MEARYIVSRVELSLLEMLSFCWPRREAWAVKDIQNLSTVSLFQTEGEAISHCDSLNDDHKFIEESAIPDGGMSVNDEKEESIDDMARTNLKKVEVPEVPRGVYTGTGEPVKIRDPIYPRKQEVRVGSIFSFHGHSVSTPTTWIVEAIYTYSYSETGVLTENYVAHVKYVDDIVVLRSEKTRELIERRFSWLSVSAAWRLET